MINFQRKTHPRSTGSVKVSSRAGSFGQVSIFDNILTEGKLSLSMDDNVANIAAVNICASDACRPFSCYRL